MDTALKTGEGNAFGHVKRAAVADAAVIADLACELWPEHSPEEMTAEFQALLAKKEAAVFLYVRDGCPVAFAQCQLRHDYVEGTGTSPVGYLEGIFVKAEERRRGIARQLLSACEKWSGDHGCTEFASDCELSNLASRKFHLAVGFEEANRIIAFVRKIGAGPEETRNPGPAGN